MPSSRRSSSTVSPSSILLAELSSSVDEQAMQFHGICFVLVCAGFVSYACPFAQLDYLPVIMDP